MKKKRLGICVIIIIFLFLSGCLGQEASISLTEVNVKLKWVHQAQFAGNYIAKENGYYKDEGLDVTLNEFTFENPTIDAVVNDDAIFGITGSAELLMARINGEPLKAIAVIYQINPVCAYTLKSSNITKPEDFIGKTVGIERAPDGTEIQVGILYHAMLNKLGINHSDINEVTIGYDATELLSGDTDVSTGYIINEPHQAIELGYEINTILMADYGVDMYADVIFVKDSTYENKSDLCLKFLKATLKGWRYAIENEEEAVNIVLKYAKDRSYSHENYMLKNSIPLINNGVDPIGWMEYEKWENVQTILYDQDITDRKIDVKNLYADDFIKLIYGE